MKEISAKFERLIQWPFYKLIQTIDMVPIVVYLFFIDFKMFLCQSSRIKK